MNGKNIMMRLWKVFILSCFVSIVALNVTAQTDTGAVSLSPTEIVWTTTQYELEDSGAIIPSSVDNSSTMEHRFDGYILENDFLRVTLLPEFGGRILSIIYKPTGHEQLYQNPLGLPYGIGDGNFYYDWLMVYGGIFPTFPGPEHGKTWFLPWDFEIITETDDVVTIEMSFVDDIRFGSAPSRFSAEPTGLEARFRVSLHANSRAVDTAVTISNPSSESVSYEYWTSITLAPGSAPDDTRVTANTEIIAPINVVKMPPWWPATIAQEELTNTPDVYTYDNLRLFENWADMGIAYAYPTISESNFWGVINHDNEEGIIRVADNTISQGLKIWTWGYQSASIPIEAYSNIERRPYIELWAGVSPEFFTPALLPAETDITFEERYIPTVGLSGVTHASDTHLLNVHRSDTDTVELQVFSVDVGIESSLLIMDGDVLIQELVIESDHDVAQSFSIAIPETAGAITFTLTDGDEEIILSGNLIEPIE